MKLKRIFCILTAVLCAALLPLGASAVQVDSDATYCFTAADFSGEELAGICITGIPNEAAGTVMLGSRILRPGDILTAQQVEQMTFHPIRSETDLQAQMTYLPIYQDRVDSVTTMSIAVLGKTDKAPVAEDSAMETYKNLPNEALLKVKDPEGKKLIFTVTRQPRRGDVVIRDDGSFHYTPKKNKVGIDSFTYTATDPAGNVSREATVTVTITKPSDTAQYTDTAGESCRFAAEWMKNTGLFVGEQVGGTHCFQPEKAISRGEFLTMLVKTLDIPAEEDAAYTGFVDEVPGWLKPYLAAALRAGITTGWHDPEVFGAAEQITGAEAALLVSNALDLTVSTVSAGKDEEGDLPVWAATAMTAMADNGISLEADQLTRAEAAELLYQVSQMAKK